MSKGKAFWRMAKGVLKIAPAAVIVVFGVYTLVIARTDDMAVLMNSVIGMLTVMATVLLIEQLAGLSTIQKKVDGVASSVADMAETVDTLKEDSVSVNAMVEGIDAKLETPEPFLYGNRPDFWDSALEASGPVFISGGSLHLVLFPRSSEVESFLKEKRALEIVVVQPRSFAASHLYENVVKEVPTADAFSDNIVQVLGMLRDLKYEYGDLLTVRLNDQVPAIGIMATYNGSRPHRIQMNLYSEKMPYDKRMSFMIEEPSGESDLAYDYCCEQIKLLRERLPECSFERLCEFVGDVGGERFGNR